MKTISRFFREAYMLRDSKAILPKSNREGWLFYFQTEKRREGNMQTYKATVTRVIDGDTFVAKIDVGFDITITQRFRMSGINAPEIHGTEREDGLKSMDYLKSMIEGKDVYLDVDEPDKYGRYLAVVRTMDGVNVNDDMVQKGLARPYNGHGNRE